MSQNEMQNSSAPSNEKKLSKVERAKLATAEATQKALDQGEKNLEQLAHEAEKLKQAKAKDAEELALLIEPLCRAMLRLTEETQETFRVLREEAKKAQQQRDREEEKYKTHQEILNESLQRELNNAITSYNHATTKATHAANSLRAAQERKGWLDYALIVMVCLAATLFTNVLLQWAAPPKIENHLNFEEVVLRLKQAQDNLNQQPPSPTETEKPTKPKNKR